MPYKSETIPLRGLQDRRRKLTDEQKQLIGKEYETGNWSLNKLAKRFGVSKKTILLIVNRKVQKELSNIEKKTGKNSNAVKKKEQKLQENTGDTNNRFI